MLQMPSPRAQTLVCCLLSLIVALAAGVRLYDLDRVPLSNDECFSWRMAQYPADKIMQRTAVDVHPPLYYQLLRGWFEAWGSSPLSMRVFSACWGILAVPLIYLVTVEAARWLRPAMPMAVVSGAGLVAAALLAVHYSEVQAARSGRMYSLGAFLAGLSAWFLLRALRQTEEQKIWWWTGYGLTVSAFCYTHNYAFFTVLAQTLFVLIELAVRWRTGGRRAAVQCASGFVYAGALAFILFLPWLPALLSQAREVKASFWISELKWSEVSHIFFAWGTGMRSEAAWEEQAWLAIFTLVSAFALLRGGRGAWFFLLQALAPWALALGISVLSGRSIFVERYFVFAHFFLIAFWGWLWLWLDSWLARSLLTAVLGIAAVQGLDANRTGLPTHRPTLESAAEFLQSQLQPGDIVIVNGPPAVNCLRCYLTAAGAPQADVRTFHSLLARDIHISHSAVLATTDILEPNALEEPKFKRIWMLVSGRPDAANPPRKMTKVFERTFEDAGESSYSLVLFTMK